MKPDISNSLELLESISQKQLYNNLIRQLNKDLMLANVDFEYDIAIKPVQLVADLQSQIHQLILNDFNSFLNFLYIIDLSELEVRDIDADQPESISEELTLLILKRLWKKVWLRNKFS